MMIKFSWKKLNNKFGWNAYKVLDFIYWKQGKSPKFYLKQSFLKTETYPKGDCYFINLDAALENATDPNHLYIYLELASKRNLFDYKMRGITYLPIQFVPEYLMGLVDANPMLEVKDEKIYFKYEQR